MGGLILTVIELGKTVAKIGSDETTRALPIDTYSSAVIITRIISYLFRFLFHCVQFTFLFRYGNVSFFLIIKISERKIIEFRLLLIVIIY
jgi:hypothetical protein